MTAEQTRTHVHLCPAIPGQNSDILNICEETALAVDVLRALMADAMAFACTDGVVLAACLDHHLFERIAAMGESLIDREPDNDLEPEPEEECP